MTRDDLDACGLRAAANRCSDAKAARRMLALALVLEGWSREDAATATGMDRQTLRDWVHRYNTEGLDGLCDRKPPGVPRRLNDAQEAEIRGWVEAGPDPLTDGVVRWRRADLARKIETEFGIKLAERTVGTLLRRLDFRRLSVRPQHPRQDAQAIEAHKKTLPTW